MIRAYCFFCICMAAMFVFATCNEHHTLHIGWPIVAGCAVGASLLFVPNERAKGGE